MTKNERAKKYAVWITVFGTISLTYLDSKIGLWLPDRFTQAEGDELRKVINNVCGAQIDARIKDAMKRIERTEDRYLQHIEQHGKDSGN